MTRLFPAVIIAATTTAATEGTSLLIERHSVGLPTLMGIASVVGGASWWLASKFRQIDDKFDELGGKLNGLECLKNKGCDNKHRKRAKHDRKS